jgi:hypothetical protein
MAYSVSQEDDTGEHLPPLPSPAHPSYSRNWRDSAMNVDAVPYRQRVPFIQTYRPGIGCR